MPVTVNIEALQVGQLLKVQWRGQTIGILRRSEETLALLPEVDDQLRDPDSLESEQPEFARNEMRASRPEFLVVNMSGRVYQAVPAPTNLRIPPYSYIDDQTLLIGVDPEGAV
jgi:ubiquinol-cytochrome c reductase iron-sulfur subunit